MKKQKLSLIGAVIICFALSISTFGADVYSANNYDPVFTEDGAIYVKNEDGSMIPDKYNTGVDPSIELTAHYPTEATFTINGLVFIGRDNMDEIQLNLKNTPDIEDGAVFVIENIDFSNSKRLRFQDYNHFADAGKKVTIIFKNCKFSSFYAEVNTPLFNTEFYDCDFNHASGSHLKFERCRFHTLNGDTMNPFSFVTVKDCYMYHDGEGFTNKTIHVDGFQVYGFQSDPEIDVEEIHFDNVRIELPAVRVQDENGEWFAPLVNAPIMLQGEYSTNMHDILVENMHINGGANSIYLWCKTGTACESISNTTLRNIEVGYAHVYDIFYSGNGRGVDTATTTIENVDHVVSLYAGSAWKNSAGVHISVTNELMSERTMQCVADNGATTTHTIPAHPTIPVNNQHVQSPITDYPVASDLPYDLDVVVADATANEVNCYDITEEANLSAAPLIRTARFNPSIVLASSSQNGQNNTNGATGDTQSTTDAQSATDAPSTKEELPAELPAAGGIENVFFAAFGAGAYVALLSYLVIHFSNKRRK